MHPDIQYQLWRMGQEERLRAALRRQQIREARNSHARPERARRSIWGVAAATATGLAGALSAGR
jgi:hypothetical protein